MPVTCPKCHSSNPDVAQFCSFCGAPLADRQEPPSVHPPPLPSGGPSYQPPPPPPGGSDKGTLALILGILSLIACGPLTGIPGIIIARSEMENIRMGRADPQGMDKAKWGFYLSIAGCALTVICLCLYFILGGMASLPYLMGGR